MLLCFYTKGSKDISHINCFYFWIVSLLCFHSSSLTDVLGTFFVLVPPWPHATSFLPGITCPHSLIRSSMTVQQPPLWCSSLGQRCFWGAATQSGTSFPNLPGTKLKTSDWVLLILNVRGCTLLPDLAHYTFCALTFCLSWLDVEALGPFIVPPPLIILSPTIDFSIKKKNKLFLCCAIDLGDYYWNS